MDICGSTGAPCIHCNPGPCEHRRRMCSGCIHYKQLGWAGSMNACHHCADGFGVTRRLPNGTCANYTKQTRKGRSRTKGGARE